MPETQTYPLRVALLAMLMAGVAAPALATGAIGGTVTEAGTAAPLGSITVSIYTLSGALSTSAVTSGSGVYSVPAIAAGTYYARTSNSINYVNQVYDSVLCFPSCSVTIGTPIVVTDGVTTNGIDFALVQGGSISGTVTDSVNMAAVSSVPVQIFTSSGSFVTAASSNASGVFTATGLLPGSYFVRASLDTSNKNFVTQLYSNNSCIVCPVLTGTPVVVTGGATHGGVDFPLARGGTITGRIADGISNVGLDDTAGAFMNVYADDGSLVMSTKVWGLNGSHTIAGLPAGTYFATAIARGYLDQLHSGFACPLGVCTVTSGTPFVVAVGGIANTGTFALALGGSVTGTVTDSGAVALLSGVSVGLYTPAGTLAKSGTTNASGVFTVSGLPTGSYRARTTVPSSLNYVDQLYSGMQCPLGACTVASGTPIAVTTGLTTTGVDFALSGGGSITGSVTDAVTAGALPSTSVRVYASTGTLVRTVTANASGGFTATGLPSGNYYARTAVTIGSYHVDQLHDSKPWPCIPSCAETTGTAIAVVAGATTSGVNLALQQNLVHNGTFGNGLNGWQTFAVPDVTHMAVNVVNGVVQFSRDNTSAQATVFRTTAVAFPSGAPIMATFDLGNTSTVRKDTKVLVIDSDFSDFAACTFWLAPSAPMRTYRIKLHTTKAWTNASFYVYASSKNLPGDTGVYQVDNVSVQAAPGQDVAHVDCIDPTAPPPPGGGAGPNLLTNGDFGTNLLPPWTLFGTITAQAPAGVLEMIRPASTPPAGVIKQQTSSTSIQAMTQGQLLTATFQLGNSSGVRKRVTVIGHDNDFSDLFACVFWLAPGQLLSNYSMIGWASKPWVDATLSFYAATTGPDQWTLLDDVTFQRTPSAVTTGATCNEPGAPGGIQPELLTVVPASPAPPAQTGFAPWRVASTIHWSSDGGFAASATGTAWEAVVDTTGTTRLAWPEAVDLRHATAARLTFASWLSSRQSQAAVQASTDGTNWTTISAVPSSDGWQRVDVDLGLFVGEVVYLQLVFDAIAPGDAEEPDSWRVDDLDIEIRW